MTDIAVDTSGSGVPLLFVGDDFTRTDLRKA